MDQRSSAPQRRAAVSYLDAASGDAGQRVDNFLARHLKDVPRSLIYRILRTGEVRVNGRRARPEYRLSEGDRVRLPPLQREQRASPKQPSKSLRDFIADTIIHEDRELIVVNKPAGVAVHGGSGLSFGVIEALHALLREREMEKTYLALVVGHWPFGMKTIDLPVKTNLKQGGERVVRVHAEGQEAISTFTPIQHFRRVATLL